MDSNSRHQCMIYEGAPSQMLRSVAVAARRKLHENYRCFYLNSPPMVAGMKSYLAAADVDVADAMTQGSLRLSSERNYLKQGSFEIGPMLNLLEEAVEQALRDGFKGLWAVGDMTWEFGPRQNFGKLVEYEFRLEEMFHKHSCLSGVCQYHTDTLPREVLRSGLQSHQSVFVNETLSVLNPYYVWTKSTKDLGRMDPSILDKMIAEVSSSRESN